MKSIKLFPECDLTNEDFEAANKLSETMIQSAHDHLEAIDLLTGQSCTGMDIQICEMTYNEGVDVMCLTRDTEDAIIDQKYEDAKYEMSYQDQINQYGMPISAPIENPDEYVSIDEQRELFTAPVKPKLNINVRCGEQKSFFDDGANDYVKKIEEPVKPKLKIKVNCGEQICLFDQGESDDVKKTNGNKRLMAQLDEMIKAQEEIDQGKH